VTLAGFLLLQAVVRSVLAEVDEVFAILRGQQVAPALPQGFAVCGPPLLVLFLDLFERIVGPDGGELLLF
jgi:hypothetical protein